MTYYIETTFLTKKFGDLTAVDKLNLKIRAGEIYGLLGPNGAGKTTTVKMLCGLIRPTSGGANVLEHKIDKSITPFIGYMPQETALYLDLTVRENLTFFGKIFGLRKDKIQERERELLKFIHLEKFADTLVNNLSGGMKHRVSLACALLHEPKLLFLDEPTVGIDPELRVSFWNYFIELKESGISMLITTHYMDEAGRCDRIGFMRGGRLIAEGVPSELLQSTNTESLEDAFLEFAKGISAT
ncbi:MAG: ABC transporter ATP-binding protein [Halobacteriota archaeon]